MCIGIGAPDGASAASARSMATRWATISTASAFALKVLAQRAIWFRFAPIRASSRVRSRSTSACATVQGRTRPTDRRTRSDSVNPAERAFACHSARSASLARIFTHTSRPAPLIDSLINNGSSVYGDLREHLPQEAIEDTNQAARCLAFTLPTASGFHTARATEAVARKYLLHLGCTEDDIKKDFQLGWISQTNEGQERRRCDCPPL